MKLVLHPYPSHGTPRILEEMAMGKPEGQAVGQGGPHTSLVPLPRLLPGPPRATHVKERVPGAWPSCGYRCARKGFRPAAAWSSPGSGSKQSKLLLGLLLGLLHGSLSSMLDRETFAYTLSLMSVL